MSQYDFNNARYGTHQLIANELGNGNSVLDVGCSKGYLKKLAVNNIFYGIDSNKSDLQLAKYAGYEQVYELDLNNYELFETDQKFDIIVFGDILEHLLFPERVLNFFVDNYLKKNGKVVISLPNVANIVIRLRLLAGNFDYAESGILDKTHLHLYTLRTARGLVESCGLEITLEKFSSNNFGRFIQIFPFLRNLLGYNLIFICRENKCKFTLI